MLYCSIRYALAFAFAFSFHFILFCFRFAKSFVLPFPSPHRSLYFLFALDGHGDGDKKRRRFPGKQKPTPAHTGEIQVPASRSRHFREDISRIHPCESNTSRTHASIYEHTICAIYIITSCFPDRICTAQLFFRMGSVRHSSFSGWDLYGTALFQDGICTAQLFFRMGSVPYSSCLHNTPERQRCRGFRPPSSYQMIYTR